MLRNALVMLSGFAFLLPAATGEEKTPGVDLSDYPTIEGEVVQVLGHLNSYIPPEVGDRLTLDLSQLGQLAQLKFELGKPEPGISHRYIPLDTDSHGVKPLTVESIKRHTNGAFQSMRLISASDLESSHAVKVHIGPYGSENRVRIWIMVESDVLNGIVLVEGKVKGTFPQAEQSRE